MGHIKSNITAVSIGQLLPIPWWYLITYSTSGSGTSWCSAASGCRYLDVIILTNTLRPPMSIVLSKPMYTRVIQYMYSEPSRIYIYNSIIMTRWNDNTQMQEAFVGNRNSTRGWVLFVYIKAITTPTGLSSYGEEILDDTGVNHWNDTCTGIKSGHCYWFICVY